MVVYRFLFTIFRGFISFNWVSRLISGCCAFRRSSLSNVRSCASVKKLADVWVARYRGENAPSHPWQPSLALLSSTRCQCQINSDLLVESQISSEKIRKDTDPFVLLERTQSENNDSSRRVFLNKPSAAVISVDTSENVQSRFGASVVGVGGVKLKA